MRALHLASITLLVAFAAVGHDAAAGETDGPAPVVVTQKGPKAVKIRLSVGSATPCDSTANRHVYTGPIKPGEQMVVPFTEACACLEQTYDDFPDVGWGSPLLRCRPKICHGAWCVPDARVPIYFDVQSKRPPT